MDADEWDETAAYDRGDRRRPGVFLDELKFLFAARANGDHHASPFLELIKQGGWNFWSRGGDNDVVVRSVGGDSLAAVAQ